MGRHGGGRAGLRIGLRARARARWRLLTLTGAGALALAVALTLYGGWPGGGAAPAPSTSTGVYGTPKKPAGSSAELGWGFTHTQYSADHGERAAKRSADDLLSADPMPQNQHIMGWGADNPEPAPGEYDFSDLDRRVELMRRTGATPVLTLCCAPDWMKGGSTGTDWSKKSLEKAPEPEHYQDFADLVGKIADRYPDIRHFIVWNELKGFYDNERNRWDYEGYTTLYNLVYQELKKRNKDNQVGGPYAVMDSDPPGDATNASALSGPWGVIDQRSLDAVEYWNRHKAGADFVAVDGSSYTREDDRLIPDEFAATRKFADVTAWLRRTTHLPVWWAEWYVEPPDANDDRKGWSEEHRTAVQAAALLRMARAGVAAAFYWNPQNTGDDCPGCLWRSTELDDGGAELPMMKLLSRFAKAFPPGTRLRQVDIAADDRPNVLALASDKDVLVVNTLDRAIKASVDGRSFDMAAYEVRWLER
ncbi:GH39 family glycosyl hydrolase [Streptomyces varsoviensis]|uniref:Xylan 1,4-beta-xylosidase n=1 Tax=Streptomyces varsoviensis TaxID=67373 RepID=A0ABR5JEA1_9ACTN|nr:xylan 1,4-beta-xylosidase [Streptomyces varsoviensis]KOG91391.1 xylan 1,4-beta-xylosidase [Streptomyces varsoviensis]